MDKYRDEIPTICKIFSNVPGTPAMVEVEWWYGRYSTVWNVCKKRDGRRYIPWTVVIPCSSILTTVTLTKSNHLKKETVILLSKHMLPTYNNYSFALFYITFTATCPIIIRLVIVLMILFLKFFLKLKL